MTMYSEVFSTGRDFCYPSHLGSYFCVSKSSVQVVCTITFTCLSCSCELLIVDWSGYTSQTQALWCSWTCSTCGTTSLPITNFRSTCILREKELDGSHRKLSNVEHLLQYNANDYKHKKSIVAWSRDVSAKKYTNKTIEQGWQLQVDILSYIFFK